MGFSRQEYWNGLPSPSPGDTLTQKWQNRIFSSSLKYKNNSIWYTGLNCFTDTKAPTEWRKLTTWWQRAHSPQTGWSVRVKLTPVILPCYLTINQPQTCSWVDCIPWDSTSLTFPLKMPSWNLSGSPGILNSSFPWLLAWCSAINAVLYHNPVSMWNRR